MHKVIVFLILMFLSASFHKLEAQNQSQLQLAYKYYQAKEYDKALIEFESLYRHSHSQNYLNYVVKCQVELGYFDAAEKMLKKQIRRNKNNLQNYINLGYIFERQGEKDKAEEQYDYVLKNLPPNHVQIIQIANDFLSKRNFEYAERTYKKGRGLIGYPFHLELANVYAYQRKSQEMIDEYLDMLADSPESSQIVTARLQARMNSNYDENFGNLLKKSLIKRIQKNPRQYVYHELLIWYYVQNKDFANAIIQAKAIDKRLKEGGYRLVELGGMAFQNGMYETAKEAYNYVIVRYHGNPYYVRAKLAYLNVLYTEVVKGKISSREDIEHLEKQYHEAINEFGRNTTTIRLIKNLAHLQAFYLNKSEEAVDLLRPVIDLRDLSPNLKGACKIELADILLLQDKVWEATLEYAQAEKMNKGNAIGYEASFKRAKLAFFMGDFEWAQAQLDVLKGSTTQLIANDAFRLSLLIKDNTGGADTANVALKYYARAEMLLEQNKQSTALAVLDTLEMRFKTTGLIDDVLFLKAKIYEKSGDIELAVANLKKIIENYAYDLLGDDAAYKLAEIYDYRLKNKEEAMKYYKKIIFDYKGSIYVPEARKRFRVLRGDEK
jgi:tetratricopeptide (TPR) repeat protein